MTRRRFLGWSGASLVGALAAAAPLGALAGAMRGRRRSQGATWDQQRSPSQSALPNLLLIVVDDLGWDDVGFHGTEVETPHIDGIAAGGVELDRLYAYPVCSPTRAGLLTGRSPVRVGVTQVVGTDDPGLPLDEHLLPQSLKAAGYQTWLCGKWHLGGTTDTARAPYERGFDHFYGFLGASIHPYTKIDGQTQAHDWQRNGQQVEEDEYSTFLLADEAEDLIRDRDASRPFFLEMSFRNVHVPLRAPDEYLARFRHIPDRKRRTLAAMCATVDDAVGQVVSVLDEAGIRDNTLVVFMSDNGGDTSEGGASNVPLRNGKGSMYDGGIRVPAAMQWPGVLSPGQRNEQFIAAWDLFPTLCAALGVAPANVKPLDGRDRWTQIADGTVVPHEPIIVAQGPRNAAVLYDRWKLVQVRGSTSAELYDIVSDPTESRDVADAHPEVVRDLRSRLQAHLDEAPAPETSPTPGPTQTRSTSATPSTPTAPVTPSVTPTRTPSPGDDASNAYLPRLGR